MAAALGQGAPPFPIGDEHVDVRLPPPALDRVWLLRMPAAREYGAHPTGLVQGRHQRANRWVNTSRRHSTVRLPRNERPVHPNRSSHLGDVDLVVSAAHLAIWPLLGRVVDAER